MSWKLIRYTPEMMRERKAIGLLRFVKNHTVTPNPPMWTGVRNEPFPGSRPFDIEGTTVHAGSRKAAVKKHALISKQ